jgi:pectate lyase
VASVLLAAVLAAPIAAGTATHGGAVMGAAIVRVTSLADSGPGTLRAAVQTSGPKVIVFDVGGVIHLDSDLKLSTPQTTIAGQSAPAPVTLTGASLRLRANDLVVQHIAVRPGPGASAEINGNRDAVTIGGGTRPVSDIRLENVSLSWSVDGGLDVAGDVRNVVVRDSIIAEALRNAGHPKGDHSMGMLINLGSQAVAVTGNLFAANMFRNPVIARGSSVLVGYNLIADPAENAIHFYDASGPAPLQASVIGNVVVPGRDTDSNVTAVQIPDDMAGRLSDAAIYLADNQAPAGTVTNRGNFILAATPPVTLEQNPPADVRTSVLKYAGARPAARDAVDARIVSQAAAGSLKIIDKPADVGGLPDQTPVQQAAEIPTAPFDSSGQAGLLRIEAWLCQRHRDLGGQATPQCPQEPSAYRTLLQARVSPGR